MKGISKMYFRVALRFYLLDGVPSKLKDYKVLVDSIVQEDIFKLLTSPSYFNEQLKWQDRRKGLLEIAGDILDEDVIASDKSLSTLPTILKGRTIENHRKVIMANKYGNKKVIVDGHQFDIMAESKYYEQLKWLLAI